MNYRQVKEAAAEEADVNSILLKRPAIGGIFVKEAEVKEASLFLSKNYRDLQRHRVDSLYFFRGSRSVEKKIAGTYGKALSKLTLSILVTLLIGFIFRVKDKLK